MNQKIISTLPLCLFVFACHHELDVASPENPQSGIFNDEATDSDDSFGSDHTDNDTDDSVLDQGDNLDDDGDKPGDDVNDGPDPEPEPSEPTMDVSAKNDVLWKRHRAVENDLLRAMALTRNELCNELGQYNCVNRVHLSPVGGNEPFEQGQFEPPPVPTATTSLALDRIVLSACVKRVQKDTNSNMSQRVVFKELDLTNDLVGTADLPTIDAQNRVLYQRFLSRNPEPEELEALHLLLTESEQSLSKKDFAVLSCLVIGSQVENLFF